MPLLSIATSTSYAESNIDRVPTKTRKLTNRNAPIRHRLAPLIRLISVYIFFLRCEINCDGDIPGNELHGLALSVTS